MYGLDLLILIEELYGALHMVQLFSFMCGLVLLAKLCTALLRVLLNSIFKSIPHNSIYCYNCLMVEEH